MPTQTFSGRLAVMRDLVRELEQRIAGGEVPTEGLENFKAAIDDIRLRLWALLASAYEPENRRASMQRFRLRRALDVCRSISKDLASGELDLHHAELGEVRIAADHLVLQVEERLNGSRPLS
jgi:hypothetical protein